MHNYSKVYRSKVTTSPSSVEKIRGRPSGWQAS